MRLSTWSLLLAVVLSAMNICTSELVHSGNWVRQNGDDEVVRVARGFSGERDRQGRPLYQIVSPLLVEYSVTNSGEEAVDLVLHQTPLSELSIKSNWVGKSSDLFYSGIISEDDGTFDEIARVEPGETLSNVVDLGPTTLVAIAESKQVVSVILSFQLSKYDATEQRPIDPQTVLLHNINVHLEQEPALVVAGPPGRRLGSPDGLNDYSLENVVHSSSLTERQLNAQGQISYTSDSDSYSKIPFWDPSCVDDSSLQGFQYRDTTYPTCQYLARNGYCSSSGGADAGVPKACPVSCNTCSTLLSSWTKPYIDKSYSLTSGCSESEQTELANAERLKTDICANILWCMEKKSSRCQAAVIKWFGGNASDKVEWETLREGYTRLCSATGYKYVCRPESYCEITFVYDQVRYSGEQNSVPDDVRDGFIEQCKSSKGCTYSATVAWVYGSQTVSRDINLCPIGFWIQKDFQDSLGFGGKVSTIIHELSHFIDIAGTDDLSYTISEQLSAAQSTPWAYLDNAATWDNLSEDDDHGTYTWSQFASPGTTLAPSPTLAPRPSMTPVPAPTDTVPSTLPLQDVFGDFTVYVLIGGGIGCTVLLSFLIACICLRRTASKRPEQQQHHHPNVGSPQIPSPCNAYVPPKAPAQGLRYL